MGLITVDAYLQGVKSGEAISAATGPNGAYQIVGLFPGTYKVAFGPPALPLCGTRGLLPRLPPSPFKWRRKPPPAILVP